MGESPFIVVSGLPASGKSALGRQLAYALSLPFHDKDDVLETLFEQAGYVDMPLRQRLSRQADDIFRHNVMASDGAVLVSFWRHPKLQTDSGTSLDWLMSLPGRVIELHCACSPAVSELRYRSRQRHPGHNDRLRDQFLANQMRELAALGPLGFWPTITVRTDEPYDVPDIADLFRREITM